MGQYYAPVTIDEKEFRVYSLQGKYFKNTKNYNYYNGIKLMEHSYIKNPAMIAIGNDIYKNPKKIYWLGDYADSYLKDRAALPNPRLSSDKAMEIYKKVYTVKSEQIDYDKKYDKEYEKYKNFYTNKLLVNHTKNEYINYLKLRDDDYGYVINPLSLLTAIGNGEGGGDYSGKKENLVGYWAGDVISVEDDDYVLKHLAIPFVEVTHVLDFKED